MRNQGFYLWYRNNQLGHGTTDSIQIYLFPEAKCRADRRCAKYE